MINKDTCKNSAIMLSILCVVSFVGFGIASGYGGGGDYISSNGYLYKGGQYISLNPTTSVANTPVTTKGVESADYQNWFTGNVKRTDFVKDGNVDLFDFNKIMVEWGKRGSDIPTDADRNGEVDLLDFNLLMVYWGSIKI